MNEPSVLWNGIHTKKFSVVWEADMNAFTTTLWIFRTTVHIWVCLVVFLLWTFQQEQTRQEKFFLKGNSTWHGRVEPYYYISYARYIGLNTHKGVAEREREPVLLKTKKVLVGLWLLPFFFLVCIILETELSKANIPGKVVMMWWETRKGERVLWRKEKRLDIVCTPMHENMCYMPTNNVSQENAQYAMILFYNEKWWGEIPIFKA